MKKLFTFFITLLLLLGLSGTVFAAENQEFNLTVNGQVQTIQPLVLKDGIFFAPIEDTVKMLGGTFLKDDTYSAYYIYKGTTTISIQLNNPRVLIDNQKVSDLPRAPFIQGDKFMVPLGTISEILGAYTDYDINSNTVSVMPDAANFVHYQADGFAIKVPKDWKNVYSLLSNDGKTETYYLANIENITVQLSITDITGDSYMTDNYVSNAKILYGTVGTPTEVSIQGADKAYIFEDYSDNVGVKSRKGLVVFKGNYCYIYRYTQPAAVMTWTGYDERYTTEAKYVKDLFEATMPMFILTDEKVDFTTTTSVQGFFDKTRNIIRDVNKPMDEEGNIIKIYDTVNCGPFTGTVMDIKDSQVLVYWNVKSVIVGDSKSNMEFWSNVSGVNYLTNQWMDSIQLKIVK